MLALILIEAFLITGAVVCGLGLRFWGNASEFSYYLRLREFAVQALVFAAVFQTCLYCCHLYDLNAFQRRLEEAIAVGQSIGIGCLVLALMYFLFPNLLLGRGVFFISVVMVPLFLVCSRRGLDRFWKHAGPAENILILGNGPLAAAVAAELRGRKDLNARIAGFFPLLAREGRMTADGTLPLVSPGETLWNTAEQQKVSRIVVAVEDRRNVLPIRELVRLRVQGVRVEDVHTTISALTGRVWLEAVKPSWFVFSDGFHRSGLLLIVKRTIDLGVGVVGLLLSLPVMAAVAIAIRMDSKGPVIYRQTRVGLRGKRFELLKFRSMRTDAEARGAQWAIENDPRITRVGRFLRKYRLDELPQWINVIRADMSLVGPRPERPQFVDELRKHISYYDERHSVRPGLTGWAQVQYHYGSTVTDAIRKMEYDLFYLKNMSVLFDFIILLMTIRLVTSGKGSR